MNPEQYKLIIAKSPFEILGIDLRTLYKKNIVKDLGNGYELNFDSNDEARIFYADIVHQSQKIGKYDTRSIEEIGVMIREYYKNIST